MFKTKDVPVIVSLAPSKSARTSFINKPRPPSPSEMVGSIDPMCNCLVGQAAHIDEEEVAAPVLLRCCPDPSCCHRSYRHSRTLMSRSKQPRRTLEDEASGADSALAYSSFEQDTHTSARAVLLIDSKQNFSFKPAIQTRSKEEGEERVYKEVHNVAVHGKCYPCLNSEEFTE